MEITDLREQKVRVDVKKSPAPELVDLRQKDLLTVHSELGRRYKEQIQTQLKEKIAGVDEDSELVRQLGLMAKIRKDCLELGQKLSTNQGEEKLIGGGIKDYFDCLDQWQKGAELQTLSKELYDRQELRSDFTNAGIASQEELTQTLSLWLQNDNVNCATVMYRAKDGSVVVGHTEEDTIFDYGKDPNYRPEIVSFTSHIDPKREIKFFPIPYLLPGPAFAYTSDGYIQTINGLYQDENSGGQALSNMAVWLTLVLAKEVNPEMVVSALSPYVDGYSLNIVQAEPSSHSVAARTIKFIHDKIETTDLAKSPDSTIVSTNILPEDENLETVAGKQNFPKTTPGGYDFTPEQYEKYKRKLSSVRTEKLPQIMKTLANLTEEKKINSLERAMAILLAIKGGAIKPGRPFLNLKNETVRSTIVTHILPGEITVNVGAGPASKVGYELNEEYRF